MPGNTFGKLFTVTTAGESHGPAYCCIIDGCPPRLEISPSDIQRDLDRRKPGQSPAVSQRRETDSVEILSGIFEGFTTGTPIALLIRNHNARSKDYEALKNVFRPGHADYTYQKKYGIRDHNGGGRASARETLMRVAAGAIARKYLSTLCNIEIKGSLAALGSIVISNEDPDSSTDNDFFCPDPKRLPELRGVIAELRKAGDSIGARVNIIISNVPAGLGEPVFDRLNADLAHALMSIPAVKGVEIGAGFAAIMQKGSEHRDEITPTGFKSNHAGGILGGISTGQTITAGIALKPASSIRKSADTVTKDNEPTTISVTGRHDPCVGLRAVPVAEAMVALVLMDHILRDRAQNNRIF